MTKKFNFNEYWIDNLSYCKNHHDGQELAQECKKIIGNEIQRLEQIIEVDVKDYRSLTLDLNDLKEALNNIDIKSDHDTKPLNKILAEYCAIKIMEIKQTTDS